MITCSIKETGLWRNRSFFCRKGGCHFQSIFILDIVSHLFYNKFIDQYMKCNRFDIIMYIWWRGMLFIYNQIIFFQYYQIISISV